MEKITISLETMHAEQALAILQHENFAGQRPLRSHHVGFLAQTMTHGRFIAGTTIHFVRWNGQRYLVNGQHTLSAIVQCDLPMTLTVHETTVEEEKGIADIYGRHDRGLPRQLSDSYGAHGFAVRYNLSKSRVEDFGGSLPLLLDGWRRGSTKNSLMRDQDIRILAMEAWVDEAMAFFGDVSFCPAYLQRAVYRQAVLSVVLLTYRYTGADAVEFWKQVAQDNGLPTNHPAKTLIHFLLNTPAKHHNPPLYARYVASCWNAAYEDRSLSKVYARDMLLPIFIAGTPFTGQEDLTFLSPTGDILAVPEKRQRTPADA